MNRKKPEVVEMRIDQLEAILRRAEQASLTPDDYKIMRGVFESYAYLLELIDDKNTSIRRLRKLLFGASTEKTESVVSRGGGDSEDSSDSADQSDSESPESSEEDASPDRRRGHGRNPAEAYSGGEQINVPHESLKPGDSCPRCGEGTLYEQAVPGVWIRIVGRAPLHAKVYHLQKLRCHLCGHVFTAKRPKEAGRRRYDATAISMIALLKYGTGMPFNRSAGLQRTMEIPLPASTQWDVVHAAVPLFVGVYQELIRQGAQGNVLHNDDTTVKILELMGERARRLREAGEAPARRGLFTSGVVSTKDGHQIALFFSGHQHAGENLRDVLQHRAKELDPPIQMCDALSRNLPGELKTIVANCLAHGRRKFVDIHDRFPDECRYVLESLAVVYRNDAAAKSRGMTPGKRLQYHRTKSQQTMDRLHRWLKRQFDEKRVEPNSSLGEAIRYMLNHWEALTLFLRVPNAPLDNNLCERALKRAILHRKNSYFYRTANGARVGDLYMSLIHTCVLCQANPFDYLTELQRHADQVVNDPSRWMPWNYRDTLAAEPTAA